MTTERWLSVGVALALVRGWPAADPSIADRVISLLESLDAQEQLALAPTEASALARIYRRRVSADRSVIGAEDLLNQLESYARPELLSVATSMGGWLLAMWFDDGLTEVIGCVVGRDQRVEG